MRYVVLSQLQIRKWRLSNNMPKVSQLVSDRKVFKSKHPGWR